MTWTVAQLRDAFAGGQAGPAADYFRSRGYQGRDWDGLCMGVDAWCTWFTTGAEPAWYPSATAAWDASPAAQGTDPYAAPIGAHHWFAIPGVPDGHVQVSLGGGQVLHAHSLIQDAWGINVGTCDWSWFKNQRPWYVYLGWTMVSGGDRIDLTNVAPLAPNERQVIADGQPANGRSGPSRDNAIVQELASGDVGTFKGYARGQDPYGTGNPVWFVGAFAGNYFWSGAFTDAGTHDLADLTVAAPVEPPVVDPPVVGNPDNPDTGLPYVFDADFDFVTEVIPANRTNWQPGDFPARPEAAVLHQWGDPDATSYGSVINTARNPQPAGREMAPHFVVDDGHTTQMVSLNDRAYHAGRGGNDYVGIECDPHMRPATIARVRQLLEGLRDRNGNVPLVNVLHRNVPGAATSCGTYIEPHLDELVIEPKAPVVDPPVVDPPIVTPPSSSLPTWAKLLIGAGVALAAAIAAILGITLN